MRQLLFIVVVIPGHNLGNSQVSVNRTIGPTLVLIFAQNIDRGYTLETPQRGGCNEYPRSMFWNKNKKKNLPL